MADKTIAFSLEIKGIDAQVAALNKIEKELGDVTKERNKLLKSQKEGNKLTQQESKELIKLSKRQIELKQDKAAANKEIKNSIALTNTEKGSLNSLSAQLNAVNREWRKSSQNQRLNTKRGKELTAEKKRLTAALFQEEQATGDSRRGVGRYTEGIQNALGQLGLMPPQLAAVAGATKSLTVAQNTGSKAARIFKIALASTGIGLLIVGIASLVQYFKRTEEGASKLQQILAPFKVILGNLGDLAGDLGEGIVNVFESPKEAGQAFINFLKDQVIVRVNSIIELFGLAGEIIKNVFTGEFKEAGENLKLAGKAYIDALTGVEDTAGKVKVIIEDTKTLIEETKTESAILVQLEKDKLALIKEQRAFNLREAELKAQVKEDLLLATDRTKELAERQAAINRAIANENLLAVERQRLIDEKIRLLKAEAELSDSNQETLDEINQLEIERIGIREQNATSLRRVVTQQATIQNEINAALQKELGLREQIDDIDDIDEDEIEADLKAETDLGRQDDLLNAQLANVLKFNSEVENANKDKLAILEADNQAAFDNGLISEAKYLKTKKQINDIQLDSQLNGVLAFTNSIKQIAGEESVAFKAAAIAETGINTYKGATAAAASAADIPGVGFLLAPIAAGAFIAAGLLNIAKISGINFEDGGLINGPSHSNGGVPFTVAGRPGFEAEGGEVMFSNKAADYYGRDRLLAMNARGNMFQSGGFVPAVQQAQELSDETVNRLISGINNKAVINDPIDAHNAQSDAVFIENRGDF